MGGPLAGRREYLGRHRPGDGAVSMGHQRRLEGQPDSDVLRQVDTGMPAGAPVDVGGPARQAGQMGLQVGDPRLVCDSGIGERCQNRVLGDQRRLLQRRPYPARHSPIAMRELTPRRIEPFLASRHGPGRSAEECRAPLGGVGVDRVRQFGRVLLGRCHVAPYRLRNRHPIQQVCTQQTGRAQDALAESQLGFVQQIREASNQRPIDVTVCDPALVVETAEAVFGQRPSDAEQIAGPTDGLLERHGLQSGQRIDRDERRKRVVRGQYLCRQADLGAHLRPIRGGGGVIRGGHRRAPIGCGSRYPAPSARA